MAVPTGTELKAGRDGYRKNNIRLLTTEQHFAEWCDEEEEACTSWFLNGLPCTQPLRARLRSSGAQRE